MVSEQSSLIHKLDALESTVQTNKEKLEASNKALQSTMEELQVTKSELQASKEELLIHRGYGQFSFHWYIYSVMFIHLSLSLSLSLSYGRLQRLRFCLLKCTLIWLMSWHRSVTLTVLCYNLCSWPWDITVYTSRILVHTLVIFNNWILCVLHLFIITNSTACSVCIVNRWTR